MICNQAKTLRKLISKRTEKLAGTVHSVTGVDKESLNRMEMAEHLKSTMNNGKRVIRAFNSPNLTRLHQNSDRSKANQVKKKQKGDKAYIICFVVK